MDGNALYLVRHGESEWNLAGRIQGQSVRSGGLTPMGRSQAARTAEKLALRAPGARWIVASDLVRARETAEIIAARLGLPVSVDAEFREQNLGEYEGNSFAAEHGTGTWQDVIDKLWRQPGTQPPGGESIVQLYQRVHRALRRHAREQAEIIVVTHGGAVRMASAATPPKPGRPMLRAVVDNASVTEWRVPCPVS
jgi:probable phosphoglycerate mutase